MLRFHLIFVVAIALTCTAFADPPAIGDRAPALKFDAVVQSPEGQDLSWDGLKGKVVVLEFWATWCGPCIPALAHLEEVSKEASDVPHAVLAIAVEQEWRLRTFLDRHPHDELWFVTDESRHMFDAFELVGVPNTVIVDPQGQVAALTRPEEVTAEVLRRVAKGEPAGVEAKAQKGANIDWAPDLDDSGGEIYARVVIADADPDVHGGGHQFAPGSGKISGDGAYMINMIQTAYDVPNTRIENGFGPWSRDLPRFRFSVQAPGGDDDLARQMLARSLEVKFGFSVTREIRELPCYFLRRISGMPALTPSDPPAEGEPTGSASGAGISQVHRPLEFLRSWTENLTQRPVIDETGLDGRYDFELEWVDGAGFREALKSIGLEIVEGEGQVEFLIIEPNGG